MVCYMVFLTTLTPKPWSGKWRSTESEAKQRFAKPLSSDEASRV